MVKGGYGRYGYMREEALAATVRRELHRVRGLSVATISTATTSGTSGETNRDPNGPDFIESTGHEFAAVAPNFVPNPDEKQVMFDEYSVNLERELMANFALRVTGIYTQTKHVQGQVNNFRPYEAYNIPVTNRDPGPRWPAGDRRRRRPVHVL